MPPSPADRPAAEDPSLIEARLEFRACSRRVMRQPTDLVAHSERLNVALKLPGSEPVQGALADCFVGSGLGASVGVRGAALEKVRPRLSLDIARRFEQHLRGTEFPLCSPMATCWSVLAIASMDVPRRIRRCSIDDSLRLADAAAQAYQRGDAAALDEFLEHCRVCRDSVAFVRARGEILQQGHELHGRWDDIAMLLEAAEHAA